MTENPEVDVADLVMRLAAVDGPSGLVERPLCDLAPSCARNLITELYGPEERLARALHRFWRDVQKQSDDEAVRSTLAELAELAEQLLSALDDPLVHTVGRHVGGRYVPFGLFSVRDIRDHEVGQQLSQHLDALPAVDGTLPYSGRRALGHRMAILDELASLEVFGYMLVSMAAKAIDGDFAFVLYFSSDHRLERIHRRFGFDFPSDVAPDDFDHLVGVYDVNRPSNMKRLMRVAPLLGVPIGVVSA